MIYPFAALWNRSFDEPSRPPKTRNYLYASELKGKPYDTVLSMLGVLPTSEPNARAKRKFQAGNLFEFIVKVALQNCGLYKVAQEGVKSETNGIEISGKIDFVVGGKPNFDNRFQEIVKEMELGDGFESYLFRLQENFKNWYNEKQTEFFKEIWEIKSVSAHIFDGIEMAEKPKENHELQIYHYVCHHPMITAGRIVYICRDDLRIREFHVTRSDSQLYAKYAKEAQKLRDLYEQYKTLDVSIYAEISLVSCEINTLQNDIETFAHQKLTLEKMQTELAELREKASEIINPFDFENMVVINETTGRLQSNWRIEYSNYLTHYYYYNGGEKVFFETPESYRSYVKDISGINAVLNRVFKKKLEGKFDDKTLTKSNKEKIELLKNKYGYNFDEVYAYFEARQKELIRKGVTLEEDEDA